MASDGASHDVLALLSSDGRDFLIRKNGDQVKIGDLLGKIVGLYFSGSWCGPCRQFTPILTEVYEDLSSKSDFEVVFISSDRDEESFNSYFSKMPWLAIPFSDSTAITRIKELFQVRSIPSLVILDGTGTVSSEQGVKFVREYGADAYPFTHEKLNFLRDEEVAAKKNQSLSSLLVSNSRDYLISSNGEKVLVSDLEGKLVGLYFSFHSHKSCTDFTPKLAEACRKLKDRGENNFEIVLVSLDNEEEDFRRGLEGVPFLALPFKDRTCQKLVRYFELKSIPFLPIIGTDGKTLHNNVTDLIQEHGVDAFPFSPEKVAELAEIEKAKLAAQTLESVLVLEEHDFVIDKTNSKIPVSNLVGKSILLYFSAHWCPPCRAFLPKLITAYGEIKEKDEAFEVIFISSDRDQPSFNDFFSGMPWLALPFDDPRTRFLKQKFKIRGIPALVALGPSGRTITTEARKLITSHGAEAYPFTEEHLQKLEEQLEEMAKGWPEKIKHELHPHELLKTRRSGYVCIACNSMGAGWSFSCRDCDFDLHPKCCLKMDEEAGKEGWTCDGDVCRRA